MMVDILKWFLVMMLGLFVVWVLTGGPQRAEQKNLTPIITGPGGVSSQPNNPSTLNSASPQN
jgi:hypothetical protein